MNLILKSISSEIHIRAQYCIIPEINTIQLSVRNNSKFKRHLKIFRFAELILLEWFLRKLKCPYMESCSMHFSKELMKQLFAITPAEARRELFLETISGNLGLNGSIMKENF